MNIELMQSRSFPETKRGIWSQKVRSSCGEMRQVAFGGSEPRWRQNPRVSGHQAAHSHVNEHLDVWETPPTRDEGARRGLRVAAKRETALFSFFFLTNQPASPAARPSRPVSVGDVAECL